MTDWVSVLLGLQQAAEPGVMVTVASTVGSTPREAGAKMIVTRDRLFGTIGGGNLELQACSIARDQLGSCELQQLRRFPLGAGLGQCCGGLVNLLFEPITQPVAWLSQAAQNVRQKQPWVRIVATNESSNFDRSAYLIYSKQSCYSGLEEGSTKDEFCRVAAELLASEENTRVFRSRSTADSYFAEVYRESGLNLTLFGAGHVGRAIVNVMSQLDVNIRWVDSRAEQFPRVCAPNVEIICQDIPEAEVDTALPGSYFLVLTHDHGLDQLLTQQILKRSDFAYFGLIGSKSKRRNFETRMLRRGIDASCFKRITCPIGVDGIRSKQPAVIAISVAAQIMQVYDQRCARALKINNDEITVRQTL